MAQKISGKIAKTPAFNSSKKSVGKPTTMAELLAQTGYQIPTLRRGQEVHGQIISITPAEILVEIGAKSEGIVAGRELAAIADIVPSLSVGDEVDAVVLVPENDSGQVVLSLRKLSGERRWRDLEEKRDRGESLEVVAIEVNRGGVICDYFGLRGFLPASQLAQTAKADQIIGKNLAVNVLEIDRSTNRLIFSQKQSKETLEMLLKLLAKVKIGEQYEGMVSAVLPFGVFVEIDLEKSKGKGKEAGMVKEQGKELQDQQQKTPNQTGLLTKNPLTKLEGLVHISEIAWEKVDDLAKLFKVGDKASVMVTSKDEATGRLNLSIKQLAQDPFLAVSEKYAKDQQVAGTVARVTPYGVFVTLENGVEGLIHISKIEPNIAYEQGQSVECLVESVDSKSRRIALVPVTREKPVLYR